MNILTNCDLLSSILNEKPKQIVIDYSNLTINHHNNHHRAPKRLDYFSKKQFTTKSAKKMTLKYNKQINNTQFRPINLRSNITKKEKMDLTCNFEI